jgi:hypothetical protein
MGNIQLEAAKKMFEDFTVNVGDLLSKNPKEM